jgi:hypothetical protein
MRFVNALTVICAIFALSLFPALLLASCGLRVSSADFPVFKLSSEPKGDHVDGKPSE